MAANSEIPSTILVLLYCSTDPGTPIKEQVNVLAAANPESFTWMPENLFDALKTLEGSDFMKDALGPELVNAFIKMKRSEWNEYAKHLTSWETKWYLNC